MPDSRAPQLQAPGIHAADMILLRFLGGIYGIGATTAEGAFAHWLSERKGNERFGDYLVRSGLGLAPLRTATCHLTHASFPTESELQLFHATDLPQRLPEHYFGTAAAGSEMMAWELSLPGLAFVYGLVPSGNAPVAASQSLSTAASSSDNGTHVRDSISRSSDVKTKRIKSLLGGSSQDVSLPEVGQILGRCLLEGVIGRGGSGVVFRAQHQKLNITVAVKILQSDNGMGTDRLLATLRSEAQFLAQVNHPNVVRVYDFDDEGEVPYLVLEFVEGSSVAELIDHSGRFEPRRASDVARLAAEGLHAGSRLGIIHRDVKPGNILLSKLGMVKVADLGLARLGVREVTGGADRPPDEKKAPVGTALYMSPEQALRPSDIDLRSDIYSLGATLYHMLTGQAPFRGRSRAEVLMKHARETPTAPRNLVADIPSGLSELVLAMLAKEPSARPQSYEAVIAGLQRYSGDQSRPAGPSPNPAAGSIGDARGSRQRPRWSVFNLFGGTGGRPESGASASDPPGMLTSRHGGE